MFQKDKVRKNKTIEAFFALLRAGLWEKDVVLSQYGEIDFEVIYRLAEEQSVVGLVAAGFEHVQDIKISKDIVLQFVGNTLQLEKKNTEMNCFLRDLYGGMEENGILALLVKGQGIAQCYCRPLWRSCGDIDFFLDRDNYENAKNYLLPLSSSSETEGTYGKHLGMFINNWVVELHGNMRCGLSHRMDRELDDIQNYTFAGPHVRGWNNNGINVLMPNENEDIIYTFTHFFRHFYNGGIGLRQICDWCRLLWYYRNSINQELLAQRIDKLNLLAEWRAFGALGVYYLGMPEEAMPLFSKKKKFVKKSDILCNLILQYGNFGQNRDMSYYKRYPYLIAKGISALQRASDLIKHSLVFPYGSFRFFPYMAFNGLRSLVRGE